MNLINISNNIRKTIIEIANRSRSAHVGTSLSCVDILTELYFDILRIDNWEERDIFVMSKAHGAMSLYSTLAERGIISRELLYGYNQNNGTLPAHLDIFTAKGIEVSAGSLGHGFNIALGIAYGFLKKKFDKKIYALIGDGESQEGSIWEGALFGSKLKLSNFTAVIDYNNLQGYGRANDICHYEPIKEKWEAFGWHVIEIDGNNIESVIDACAMGRAVTEKPVMILAYTIPGKGVDFMENDYHWHGSPPNYEQAMTALKELRTLGGKIRSEHE